MFSDLIFTERVLGPVVSLAIGMLIGLERGWQDRSLPQGARAAGLRTFTITGLLGGVLASLPEDIRVWSISAGLLSVAAFMAIAYWRGTASGNQGMTTAITLLLTFALGAYAALENAVLALGFAVITALLLNLKETLHGWLHKIEPQELRAGLQLLVLSIVVLPNLPDMNMGPYGALNPYRLWWAVILIAILSMGGHVAMRTFGANRGVLFTGLLGGLASSTATTLALSRLVRQNPTLSRVASAGALFASGMMALRLLLVLLILQNDLFLDVMPALLLASLVLFSPVVWVWRHTGINGPPVNIPKGLRPYSLQAALVFGGFLAAVGVAVPLVETYLGQEGVYVVAAVSGLADVDAITISLSNLYGNASLTLTTAAIGVLISALVNLFAKLVITLISGSPQFTCLVGAGYAVAVGSSALLYWLAV